MKTTSEQRYEKIILTLTSARGDQDKYVNDCEDFFYGDVEDTKSQFTKNQKKRIELDYNIPVSINVLYPAIDQVKSFLLGNKPNVRLIPVATGDKNTAYIMQELYSAVWYKESGQDELSAAITDTLVTGSGYLMCGPANIYNENTFNVTINHVPRRYVYPDPNCIKWDLSDAEYILVAKSISARKASQIFNINLDTLKSFGWLASSPSAYDGYYEVTDSPVTINDLYIKEYISKPKWLSFNGKLSDTPNDQKAVQLTSGTYIKRVVLLGTNKILWEGYLPISEYPIVHIPCVFRPHKGDKHWQTYGLVHYVLDAQKAINKALAQLILNAQLSGNHKMLIPKGMIDSQKAYDWLSDPRRPLEYEPDPQFPTLAPTKLPTSPLPTSHYQLYQELIKMVEYILGVWSQMQGNPTDSPNTFGATQAISMYGSQRIKQRAGVIDSALAKLAHCVVNYLSFFSDEGKVYRYISDTNIVQDPQTGEMIESETEVTEPWRDIRLTKKPGIGEFDVIAIPHPSTPSSRMLASQLLGMLAGQTRDPQVAGLLTEYALKLMDIPEADELLGKVDAVKTLQQQLQQMQMQMEQLGKQNDALLEENIKVKKADVENRARYQINAEKSNAMKDIQHEKEIGKITNELEQTIDAYEPMDEDIVPNEIN